MLNLLNSYRADLTKNTKKYIIGIKPNNSSLMSFGINYKQIDLVNNDFDYDKI